MENQQEESNPCQDIAGKLIPNRWVDALKTGNYNKIYRAGCWTINTRNGQIISFVSKDEMEEWETNLIQWRNTLRTKSISSSSIKSRKTKRKSKRPKVVSRKDFVVTDAFRRMKNDSDYWREQP